MTDRVDRWIADLNWAYQQAVHGDMIEAADAGAEVLVHSPDPAKAVKAAYDKLPDPLKDRVKVEVLRPAADNRIGHIKLVLDDGPSVVRSVITGERVI